MPTETATLRRRLAWTSRGRPALARDGTTLVLAWTDAEEGTLMVARATDAQMSIWRPVELSADRQVPATDPAVTIGPTGEMLLAWAEPRQGRITVVSLGRPGSREDLSLADIAPAHEAAICSKDGRLLLAWTDREHQVWLASRASDGWTDPIAVAGARASGAPSMTASGDAVWLAWVGADGTLRLGVSRGARRFDVNARDDARPTTPPAITVHGSGPVAAWLEDDVLRVAESVDNPRVQIDRGSPCSASSGPAIASTGRDIVIAWSSDGQIPAVTITQPQRTRPDLQSEFVFHGDTVRYDPMQP